MRSLAVDGALLTGLADAKENAQRLKAMGYDGLYTLEGNRDPFYPLLLAAEHAEGLDLTTAIAVAFPRNPMTLASQSWDLHAFSRGHFMLGLGSQVRAHIENRFGAQFSRPAARMRELILAIKAIWSCWHDGERLDFRGDFYTHTLMTPMFNAGPNPFGKPPILLGALGPRMTAVAGEVADGIIVHPFNSMPFIHDHTLPALGQGLRKSGRKREDFIVSVSAMIITGSTEEEYAHADQSIRRLLAFYGSTPAYRPPMEACGFGELQEELNAMSKKGQWAAMGQLVDDTFVDAFCVHGEPHTIAGKLLERYGEIADRLSIYAPYGSDPSLWPPIVAELKRGRPRR
jgi:probable F420-dependent oxidoreductase